MCLNPREINFQGEEEGIGYKMYETDQEGNLVSQIFRDKPLIGEWMLKECKTNCAHKKEGSCNYDHGFHVYKPSHLKFSTLFLYRWVFIFKPGTLRLVKYRKFIAQDDTQIVAREIMVLPRTREKNALKRKQERIIQHEKV